MPVITRGFAEVEERVERVRRRLNARAVAHAAAVAGSAVVLVATALVVLEFRLSAGAYIAAAWSGVLLAAGVVAAAAIAARRRWLDTARAALVADRHGRLADRLTTLVGVRAGRPPSRLLPTLLAQTLVLGDRWQPEAVVPWRLPRSLWWLGAALLALFSTPLFVVQPPPPPSPAAEPPAGALWSTAEAPPQPGPRDAVALMDGDVGDSPTDTPAAASRPMIAAEAAQTIGGEPHGAAPAGESDRSLRHFAERLRRSLARPFRPEPEPRQTARNQAPSAGFGRMSEAGSARGSGQDDAAQSRQTDAQTAEGTTRQQSTGTGAATGRQPPPGRRGSAAKAEQQRSEAAPSPEAPPAPGAGSGSSPESLLAGRGSPPVAGTARAFKLTLTSFLHAAEQQDPSPPSAERREAAAGRRGGGGERGTGALNESQLANDPIRKAAIPGEYEDLIRRVYAQRPAP